MASEQLLGPIPDGWEYTTLGMACERGGGDIQTGPFGSQLHASDYVPVGIPSIMPQNIGDNRIVEDGIARIKPDDAKRLGRYLVRPGDIVYSRRGDVERRALIHKREDGWLCGTGCLRVRLGDKVVDPRYASFYLGHPNVREWVVRHAHGATMPNLNTSILAECPFLIPPLSEQRAIAHILGTLDDKIEANRRMNETLEAMARVLFKSWFVDFDPVRAKVEGRDPGLPKEIADLFPDSFGVSESGEIPKGWQVATVADVVEQLRDGENPADSPNVMFSHFSIPAFDEGQWPKQELGESIKSQKLRVPPGIILLSKLNPEIERVWLVDVQQNERAICSTEFLVLRPRPPYGLAYAYCLARSPVFRRGLQGLVTGTSKSHQRAQAGSILGLATVTPPESLIKLFERSAYPFLERTIKNRRESRTLAVLRDTLLPKLISGEIRLMDAERFGMPVVEVPRLPTEPLYTIGHSNHSLRYFISLLKKHGIQAVADVRSSPFSRRSPQFNRDALQKALRQSGITYVYLGEELGGRPDDPACYANGRADFGRMSERPAFKKGIERLVEGMGKYRIALLCAEKEPINCHRTLLVCRHLRKLGLSIRHILSDGGIEDHRDTELRLVSALKLEPNLFDHARKEEDRIQEAYNRRSGEIAASLVREESNHDK